MRQFPFEIILDWYKDNGRHELPWRQLQTPYHVWISEIFLQQTQVTRVKQYFNRVVSAFPSIEDFEKLSYDEFFPYYKGLGYYSRARNMLKTSEIIVKNYNGVFPDDYNDLINLPGVGPYTAQAILSFGHNKNILAFDTNIEKIFSRYYFGNKFKKLPKTEKQDIQNMFEQSGFSGREMNAAMMDFSSLIDINSVNLIDFEDYPLIESEFYKTKGTLEIKPEIIKKPSISKKDAKIIVVLHENHEIYFSKNPDSFVIFEFEAFSGDHRHHIQDIFRDQHSLELSVRPVYKKITSLTGNYFFYHAQIQSGQHDFGEFSKSEKLDWENNF